MPGGASGGAGGGYNYVQDSQPNDPKEGEEWYDTGANAAYVYDGANWVEQTVVDHGQLSGVASGDHHTRYTDPEAVSAVDGSSLSALDIDGTPVTTGIKQVAKATAFDGSDGEAVSGSNYTVNNSELGLPSGNVGTTNGYDGGDFDTANAGENYGLKFDAQAYITSVTTTVNGGSNSPVVLQRASDGTEMARENNPPDQTEFTMTGFTLTPGNTYRLYVEDPGGGYDLREAVLDSNGDTAAYNNIQNYATDGQTPANDWYLMGESYGTALTCDYIEGPATAYISHSVDEYKSLLATAKTSPDGGTADVYVEFDDGTGWTTANDGNPISRHTDLSNIPSGSDVRFRAELDISDGSQNPAVQAVARTYTI